jgi:Zn ribbon nucleic-acid-binding protein
LARTTLQTNHIEIQNIPCVACQECGHEQIGQRVQKKIGKLLERAAKGKLKTGMVVM